MPSRSHRTRRSRQADLAFRSHGGARRGAGRKPKNRVKAGASHAVRAELSPRHPVHLTLRPRAGVWNLRSRRAFRVIGRALLGLASARRDFRVVHFSVQGNHLHLLAEVQGKSALTEGARSLAVRLAMGLNRLMGTRGQVFDDRYHAHVLRTPSEVKRALAYVLGNFASHARRRGEPLPRGLVDPFSSAAFRRRGEADAARVAWGPPRWFGGLERLVAPPRTWLLRTAA
ncbi:hypothetical protein [Anaeromyxobacter paludicola]|uniref:Transposase IS200-like domain-containing protein n=1 Tax=Anaeromyxobacter paludicola TaxID=2918171 RepID=A0ABM7XBH3_9BACT|nr:hypothetical protein [Anaeromyxobacter paludicola]BDG09181.1 hypothetical protein AMPC_22940 [Anaeromyxobacter paludicola]